MSDQACHGFATQDMHFAIAARAKAGNVHPRATSTGLLFCFPSLSQHFMDEVEAGLVQLDARDFIAAHRAIWALISQFKRRPQ